MFILDVYLNLVNEHFEIVIEEYFQRRLPVTDKQTVVDFLDHRVVKERVLFTSTLQQVAQTLRQLAAGLRSVQQHCFDHIADVEGVPLGSSRQRGRPKRTAARSRPASQPSTSTGR